MNVWSIYLKKNSRHCQAQGHTRRQCLNKEQESVSTFCIFFVTSTILLDPFGDQEYTLSREKQLWSR